MTIDELMRIYSDAARAGSTFPQYETPDHRAGIAAVVRALRDEIIPERMRITRANDTCTRSSLRRYFNEILGDAVEKVAGGSTREDECGLQGQVTPSPATAPAPAVCEWEPRGILHGTRVYLAACDGGVRATYGLPLCPNCKAPIKFTEAKT